MGAWPALVGPQVAGMSQPISFVEGELIVKVGNASLYALLCQVERPRLLKALRERFPQTRIDRLTFRMG